MVDRLPPLRMSLTLDGARGGLRGAPDGVEFYIVVVIVHMLRPILQARSLQHFSARSCKK